MRKFIVFIILGVALIFCACGIYTFNPGGKSSIKTIAVSQFENKTIESGLSSRMTDLIVDAFIADGNMKVVSEESADALLIGTLVSYNREAYTYDELDNVSQYVVKLVFDVTLKKGRSDEDFWTEKFNSEGIYSALDQTEEDGQVAAVEKLVIDVINRTTKSW